MDLLSLLYVVHGTTVCGLCAGLAYIGWMLGGVARSEPDQAAPRLRRFLIGSGVAMALIGLSGVAIFTSHFRNLETAPAHIQTAIGLYIAAFALFLRLNLLQYPALQAQLKETPPAAQRQEIRRVRWVLAAQALLIAAAILAVAWPWIR